MSVGITSTQAQVVGGQYMMIATGSCLHSTSGFNETAPPYIPKINAHSKVWGATTMAQATWNFKNDGTGSAVGINYATDFPPGGPILKSPAVRQNPFVLNFSYEVTGSSITITLSPVSQLIGTVSEDENTLIIDSAYQVYNLGPPMGYAVCNTARVLTRVGDLP